MKQILRSLLLICIAASVSSCVTAKKKGNYSTSFVPAAKPVKNPSAVKVKLSTGAQRVYVMNGSLVLNKFNNNYWDKYEGYDLNKDKLGDVPYRPVSMYAMIIEQNPPAMILFRSFMSSQLDKTEKILPSLTPEDLKDDHPLMKSLPL